MILIIILLLALIFSLVAKNHIEKIRAKNRVEETEEVIEEQILDEKDSIKQAEEIIKKRKRLSRSVKLSVASVLIIAIGIVVGIFMFDVYEPKTASFNNSSTKEYWNTLPGFEHYDDLYAKYVNTQNINHADYISPYTDPNASVSKKMKQARYKEELNLLISPYESELDDIESKLEEIESGKLEVTEKEHYDLKNRKNELDKIVDEGKQLRSSLKGWNDYVTSEALGYKLLASEGDYEFWLNMSLTTFKVVDKSDPSNIVEWYSNAENKNDVLRLYYSRTGRNVVGYGTYDYSTSTMFKGSKTDVNPNFAVKQFTQTNENGKEESVVQVWYCLEERGVNYTYFPKYISKATFDKLIQRNKELAEEGYEYEPGKPVKLLTEIKDRSGTSIYKKLFESSSIYSEVKKGSNIDVFGETYYEYKSNLSNLSDINLETMYYLYTHCGFTVNDLAAENEYFQNISDEKKLDMEIATSLPSDDSFTVAIQYILTEDGLNITIPGNSITESGENLVVYIELLEYFTSSSINEEGYTIIPDGSGAILNHNNGKTNYSMYNKRLYTTDLSMTPEVLKNSTEDIMLPMYAVVNTDSNSGVIVDVREGAAQMELYADISGRGSEKYNKNYFRIYYHESQTVKVSAVMDPILSYNHLFMNNDVSIDFRFIGKDVVKQGYSGVAKEYRELLIERYNMQDKKDTTDELVIDIDILGSYEFDNNFLGIIYSDKEVLTTYEQLKEIINSVEKAKFKNINIFYKGWRNTTLVDKSFKNIKEYKELGKLEELAEIEKIDGVTVYPYINFGKINSYQESFGKQHYNTRNVVGDIITIYPYDLQSNVWNKKAQAIQVVSPRYFAAFAQSLADNYSNLFKIGKDEEILSNISLDTLGSQLTGDYQKNKEMFKINAVYEQINALEIMKNAGITNINLYRPYDYAFKYVTNAKDIPYTSTQYEILDYSIPFYQLVVNGLFDYSGESINANSEDGTNLHILKILETGSNASFTFTYEGSEVLLTTDYNKYYYTHYEEWLEDVEHVYNAIDETGINGCQLVKHEYLAENVCEVTYQNPDTNEVIIIIINYTRTQYYDSETGISVPAKSYKVI